MNSTHELIHWRLTAMIPRIPQLEWGKKAWDSRLFPGHFLCVLNLISVSQTLILLLLFLLSCFSRVRLCATPQMAAHQAPLSRDSPGKNTGVGCHFLLQRMKVKSESEVAQSCLTLSNPMDCSLPSSSIHGIFQARVLEWGAIAFSSRSSQNCSISASSALLVGTQTWITVILNGLPWK